MTRNYTIYRYNEPDLETIIQNNNLNTGKIYISIIGDYMYYMADVEIIKPEINIEKIQELIHQIEVELQI